MSYRVTNRATGSVFVVEKDETVLQAARRQGVNFCYSCLTGNCVACRAPVVEGKVHYPKLPPNALSAEEREQGLALLCQAVPLSNLTLVAREIEALRQVVTRQFEVRVASLSFPVDDVALLKLDVPTEVGLGYLAGQYLDVMLEGDRRRAFSIAGAPHGEQLELHVRHVAGGGFTDYVFDELTVGDRFLVEAPLGTFFLRDRSPRPMICMAGGTGFAPIKAIIEEALHQGDERPLRLYWGAESRRELYLDDLARCWAEDYEHIHYIPVLSGDADPDWNGRRGWVHDAVLADHNDLSPFDIYMSGPPPMINCARPAFLQHGLPEHHLYFDSFEFAPDIAAKLAEH